MKKQKPLRKNCDQLLQLLESFFRDYLQRSRGASRNTIFAYRDSLKLFFSHLAEAKGGDIAKLRIEDITEASVLAFLDYLESKRRNSISTRNGRLTAIRSLCRYLIRKDPTCAAEYGLIVSISGKKGPKPDISYLEPSDVKLLLEQPNKEESLGLRDYTLIQFLYNTGVRVSEALSLRVDDLELGKPRQIRVEGKGRKARVCPIWRDTATLLKAYITRWNLGPDSRLFCNARSRPLTRSGVAFILNRHFETAKKKYPVLRKKDLTPHVMRHSCACALLQSGVDLVTVRDLLGHESVRTTGRYTKANLTTKRRALEEFWKTLGHLDSRQTASWKPKPELLEFLASL